MSITLANILDPALRMAGISKRPGITPSDEMYGEMIPATNRMLASWSCDGHRVFTTAINEYDLIASQKIYTIGPGGDFNSARPLFIRDANFIFPTNPQLRRPIKLLDDDEWSKIAVQDIAAAPPWYLYFDGGFDLNGRAKIYIVGQPPTGYKLELFTWQALKSDFTATTDAVIFPPGYEKALVSNLAIEAAMLYPLESVLARNAKAMDKLEKQAGKDLKVLIVLNSAPPVLRSEAAFLGRRSWGSNYGGVAIGGGSGGDVTWISPNSAPDGSATTFTFASAPRFAEFNGLLQFVGGVSGVAGHAGYELLGSTVLRFIDNDGNVITPGVTDSIKCAI